MRRQVKHFFLFMLVFGLFFGVGQAAFAKKKEDRGIANALGDVEWGTSKVKVLDVIKDAKLKTLSKDKKLRRDRVRMQRERSRVIKWHEGVKDSYTRFDGKKSGYEVSIIANHYTDNNGESMLVARDKVAQRFFFFIDGQFYKLVVAYKQDYIKGVGFEAFAAQTARKYGRPVSTEYGELYGEEELVKVTWKDRGSVLDIENKREFFGTFTMVFTDRERLKKLRARERAFGGSDKGDEDVVSGEVASLTKSDGDDRNSGVVDSLVGGVDIDLNEGRPKDEQIRQPSAKSDGGGGESDAPKKKKKKKKKKRRKKKVTKRDFSDLKDKAGDDELIIY